MFELSIEQLMNMGPIKIIEAIKADLTTLKTSTDTNERILLKDRISLNRSRLLSTLMLEDIKDPFRFRLGESVRCWHPLLLLSSGDIEATVIDFYEDPTDKLILVEVSDKNGFISKFAPHFVKRNIPREISSFTFWP